MKANDLEWRGEATAPQVDSATKPPCGLGPTMKLASGENEFRNRTTLLARQAPGVNGRRFARIRSQDQEALLPCGSRKTNVTADDVECEWILCCSSESGGQLQRIGAS